MIYCKFLLTIGINNSGNNKFNLPTTLSTIQEAKLVLKAVEEDSLSWANALDTAVAELDEALRDYQHVQQQVALADGRVGKVIWMIKKHGFGSITRPHTVLQPHCILHDGCEYFSFLSVTLLT